MRSCIDAVILSLLLKLGSYVNLLLWARCLCRLQSRSPSARIFCRSRAVLKGKSCCNPTTTVVDIGVAAPGSEVRVSEPALWSHSAWSDRCSVCAGAVYLLASLHRGHSAVLFSALRAYSRAFVPVRS